MWNLSDNLEKNVSLAQRTPAPFGRSRLDTSSQAACLSLLHQDTSHMNFTIKDKEPSVRDLRWENLLEAESPAPPWLSDCNKDVAWPGLASLSKKTTPDRRTKCFCLWEHTCVPRILWFCDSFCTCLPGIVSASCTAASAVVVVVVVVVLVVQELAAVVY